MTDLVEFAKDLFIIEGPLVRDLGFWFTTRMTVVKLTDGSLFVDSPVPVSFDMLNRVTQMGPVKYLVAATPRHFWRLNKWHTLFPEAEIWTAKKTWMTLKKRELPITGVLGERPEPGWSEDLDQLPFKGSPLIEEVIFYHKKSRTIILDDLIQANPVVKGNRVLNALAKLDGGMAPNGGVILDIRLTIVRRKLARQCLAKLLSWDFDRLIIAHGPCISENAKEYVEHVFKWLAR